MRTQAETALSDDPLVFRIKARDLNAFRLLVRRYIDRTYAVAFCIVGMEAKADDTVQRVFLELWHRPSYFFDGSGSLMVRLLRKTIAFSRTVEDKGIAADARATTHDSIIPAAANERFGPAALVQGAIACLPPEERLILLLSCFEELSHDDIANIVRVENSVVISTLAKNRKYLRQLLRAQNVAVH